MSEDKKFNVIEKGIPIPKTNPSKRKYPLGDMQVGDSFLYIGEREPLSAAIQSYQRANKGVKFAMRKQDVGIRCWRTS